MTSIRLKEPMKDHTSFKVGGAAEIFFQPENINELKQSLLFVHRYHIPYFIMGNGSNLLVSDNGIEGAVIKIGEHLSNITIDGETVIAESGALLSTLSKQCAREGLKGIEFASGIPGSLGGAIAMNAGAYGGEMKDIVEWVELFNKDYQVIRLSKEEMDFSYRKSIVEKEHYIVLRVGIKLEKGDQLEIDSRMAELALKRKTKQPLHLPSAGSTFKRPAGYFAGQLIEDSGLRGYALGGAQVSELHCGFVVNKDHATAKDIYDLIRYVQNVVYDKFEIKLDTEVKMIGDF